MKYNARDEYRKLLNDLEFDKLYINIIEKPFNEISDILHDIAYDQSTGEGNLLVYSFLTMMIEKNDSRDLQILTSAVMGATLCFIKGAQMIGLYHGMRALAFEPDNVDTMEYLLYFHHIPEKLLSDSVAHGLAKKILEKNPDSFAAKISSPLY